MTNKPSNQFDAQDQNLREELRREHQLVRSTGAIPKRVMALAFGVVFLLIAALLAAPRQQWLWVFVFGAIGAASVAWAVYDWVQRSREPIRRSN